MPQSPFASQMMRMGPHAGAHRVALRAALSVAVPLLTLLALGRLDWAVYAAFGSFTALYGRALAYSQRVRMQATAAAVFVLCVVGGTAVGMSPARTWLVIPLAALVAVGTSMLSDMQKWHPAGPLFPIFAFTACASIPSVAGDLIPAASISLAAGAFSVLVGIAGVLLPGRQWVNVPLDLERIEPRHAIRSGVGVALAGSISTLAGIGHPYWAMVSAVVPLARADFGTQLVRGVHRVIGTFGGLLIAWAILAWEPPAIVLLLLVIAAQFGAEMLIGRNYAIALLAVTPLALIMIHLASPTEVTTLIFDRAIETVIGVAIGIAVAYATRPRATDEISGAAR